MRYTAEQLRDMANTVIKAMANDDPRSLELIVQLSLRCGMSPNEVIRRIEALSTCMEGEAA